VNKEKNNINKFSVEIAGICLKDIRYKLKLTNKNYKYYKLLESSKKVVGPVSKQALGDWRLGE
jgi:hypothetical protein